MTSKASPRSPTRSRARPSRRSPGRPTRTSTRRRRRSQGHLAARIHVFIATSALHMERKLGLTPDEVLERISGRSRTPPSTPTRSSSRPRTRRAPTAPSSPRPCREAIAAGATIVNLPDTVGYTTPVEYAGIFDDLRERCPELGDVELSVHCHDDLGLAVANSLAGVDAGATQVECTVNGIGERAGNAALEEVVMALRVRADALRRRDRHRPERDPRRVGARRRADRLRGRPRTSRSSARTRSRTRPASTRTGCSRTRRRTRSSIRPSSASPMTLPLGKHSGRHAFARACADAGRTLDRDEIDAAFRRFKQLADTRRARVPRRRVFQEVRA